MAGHIRDRIVGLVLFAVALIWTAVVYTTIPSMGSDGEVGPRAFPLIFGVALAVLSTMLVLGSFGEPTSTKGEPVQPVLAAEDPVPDATRIEPSATRIEVVGVIATFLLIVGYGFAMEQVGFVIATPILIAVILVFLLDVRRPVFVAAFAFGMTAGTYLVFNKLLGAYLPPGSLITIL